MRLSTILLFCLYVTPARAQNFDISAIDEDQAIPLVFHAEFGTTSGIFRHKAKDGTVLVHGGWVFTQNAGLFAGTKEKPIPELNCLVYRHTRPNNKPADLKELSVEKLDIDAKFLNVFYRAVVLGENKVLGYFAKPISGGAAELHIAGRKVAVLHEKGEDKKPADDEQVPRISFTSGRIHAEKLGHIEVFFDSSIDPRPLLVLSDEAISSLKKE